MALFSDEDRERIGARIAEVEQRTAGEVMVATVERSDDYTMPRVPVALGLAAAVTILVGYVFHLDASIGVLLQLGFGLVFYILLGTPTAIRLLVRKDELSARTEARALQLFSELGVHRTSGGSGILIAISEAEHRVVILADYGIHSRVDENEWSKHVDAITKGILAGSAGETVLQEVQALGDLLEREYPLEGENLNELPNRMEHRER
ncbi:MAG: hypothetical protein AAF658_03400 [Myxococcota bacterium]